MTALKTQAGQKAAFPRSEFARLFAAEFQTRSRNLLGADIKTLASLLAVAAKPVARQRGNISLSLALVIAGAGLGVALHDVAVAHAYEIARVAGYIALAACFAGLYLHGRGRD